MSSKNSFPVFKKNRTRTIELEIEETELEIEEIEHV